MLRLHVIGMSHTVSNMDFIACAHTTKVIRFCKMMKSVNPNNRVYHYGNEGAKVECDNHIDVMSKDEFEAAFGTFQNRNNLYQWNSNPKYLHNFNISTALQIRKRYEDGDIVCFFYGTANKKVADLLDDLDVFIVEPGIGYLGFFAPYKIFESYAWENFCKGALDANYRKWSGENENNNTAIPYNCIEDGENIWNNAVIPAAIDPDEFEYNEEKENYILYLGRIIPTKGIEWSVNAAKHLGLKLKIAGQGNYISLFGDPPANVELLGHANLEQRKKLMSNAMASLLLTHYTEPFGNIIIENAASGTPVITSDWGNFSDIVRHGETGYRVRNFEQTIWALKNISKIKSKACLNWSKNFTMSKIAPVFQDYFENLIRCKNANYDFYYTHPDRKDLNALIRQNP